MIFTKKTCFNSKYSPFKVFLIAIGKNVQEVFIFNSKKMAKKRDSKNEKI